MKESRYNVWVEQGNVTYVYNGVTGGLLAVSKEDYQALQRLLAGDQDSTCSPEVVEALARGRMVVSDGFDELTLLEKRYRTSRDDVSTFGLTIVTSLGCNFDCPYCFEAKHPSIVDLEVQNAILEILDDQLQRIKSFSVTWYGGEPLVGKKPLLALSDEFISRCEVAGARYDANIVTNGYLLDEETCSQLRDRKVARAQITLDGPPDIHDRMRPLVSGKGTFWRIVHNLHHAVNYLDISIRVNLNADNFGRVEELLGILADEGLSGKLSVYPAPIVPYADNPAAPSATYKSSTCCFTKAHFAPLEQQFIALAASYGFAKPSLPRPKGAPCTAVRANELVIGSKGELYKCWDSVGNRLEVIGNVHDYKHPNGRLQKWLKYDPFSNEECRSCIALPVCMGGCAHHASMPVQYENRCGTFRYNYQEQVLHFVESVAQGNVAVLDAANQPSDRPNMC